MSDDDDRLDPQLRALFAVSPPRTDDAAFVARMEGVLARARRVRRSQRLLLLAGALGAAVWLGPRAIEVSVLVADRSAGWMQSPVGWGIAALAALWALRRVRT